MWDSTKELVQGVLRGNRTSLARSITLAESSRADHNAQAELLLDAVLAARREAEAGVLEAVRAGMAAAAGERAAGDATPPSGKRLPASGPRGADVAYSPAASTALEPYMLPTVRVGIAGPPGAGKSVLIEALGMHAVSLGHRVAVLAVDPSSARTGGSILGDKTRMTELARHPAAFVRPSPSRGTLGGIAQRTHDGIALVEAAGFDVVIVETVGLGQSEVVVDDTVDMLLLVAPPAGGDELQGVKKGIMEVADMVVVNKADGDLVNVARHAAADARRALQLVRRKSPHWAPPVERCSALHGHRVDAVWARVCAFRDTMGRAGEIVRKRQEQAGKWMWAGLREGLVARAERSAGVRALAQRLEADLAVGHVGLRRASHDLIDAFIEEVADGRGQQ